ncbi:hypothetical protein [Bacillus sp. FJAT-47783]|uniref:hypothetical protein n=1 Tax=Bacillus sp. FJAT-47783 TaxID=2922712 RepID=UPI001FAE3761|nr:hypothetical protein [Bacillus sp. FJAT-47783]
MKKFLMKSFLAFSMILSLVWLPTPSAMAASSTITDIYGSPVSSVRKYIVVPANQELLGKEEDNKNLHGLTYEGSYPIAYAEKSYYKNKVMTQASKNYYGTPVMLRLEKDHDVITERTLRDKDHVVMYMTGINKFVDASDRGWISLSNDGSFMTIEKKGSNKVAFKVGKADFYYNSTGQLTDWYNADESMSYYDVDTYFHVQPSFQMFSDNNKSWGISWYSPFEYYLVPAE